MNHANRNTIKGLKGTLLAVLGASVLGIAGMGTAWATPVGSWTYNISSQFNKSATSFSSGYGCTKKTHTKLAWGDAGLFGACSWPLGPGAESSLVLHPHSGHGKTVNTYIGGGAVPSSWFSNPGITLTHNNNPIAGYAPTLLSAELDTTITLTNPNLGALPGLDFAITFDETTNSGSCPVGNNPCGDIFVFDQSSLNHSFDYLGDTYYLSLFPVLGNNVSILPDSACSAVGAALGCFGFVTAENASTPMNFGLTISTDRITASVPEPGELGIMGLGLLCLAGMLVLRRRKASAEV